MMHRETLKETTTGRVKEKEARTRDERAWIYGER